MRALAEFNCIRLLYVAVLRAGFAASLSPVAIFALAASSCLGVAALTVRRARLDNEEEGGPDDRCQMKSHLKSLNG